jgi:hypothetical protein
LRGQRFEASLGKNLMRSPSQPIKSWAQWRVPVRKHEQENHDPAGSGINTKSYLKNNQDKKGMGCG